MPSNPITALKYVELCPVLFSWCLFKGELSKTTLVASETQSLADLRERMCRPTVRGWILAEENDQVLALFKFLKLWLTILLADQQRSWMRESMGASSTLLAVLFSFILLGLHQNARNAGDGHRMIRARLTNVCKPWETSSATRTDVIFIFYRDPWGKKKLPVVHNFLQYSKELNWEKWIWPCFYMTCVH